MAESIIAPALWCDSHAHLDSAEFQANVSEVIARAAAAGVDKILCMGNDPESSRAAFALAESHPHHLYPAAGLHPHEALKWGRDAESELRELWASDLVRCVGEIGLDYYYDFAPKKQQQEAFAAQLDTARNLKKPVSIHLREAFDDGFAILREVGVPQGGVLHCFQGGPAEAQIALSLNLHLSFSGMVTFKNAVALKTAVPLVPADRYLVETDSPYLAPVPYRGKTNEPAYVVQTGAYVAMLRGIPTEQAARETRQNAIDLFKMD